MLRIVLSYHSNVSMAMSACNVSVANLQQMTALQYCLTKVQLIGTYLSQSCLQHVKLLAVQTFVTFWYLSCQH